MGRGWETSTATCSYEASRAKVEVQYFGIEADSQCGLFKRSWCERGDRVVITEGADVMESQREKRLERRSRVTISNDIWSGNLMRVSTGTAGYVFKVIR